MDSAFCDGKFTDTSNASSASLERRTSYPRAPRATRQGPGAIADVLACSTGEMGVSKIEVPSFLPAPWAAPKTAYSERSFVSQNGQRESEKASIRGQANPHGAAFWMGHQFGFDRPNPQARAGLHRQHAFFLFPPPKFTGGSSASTSTPWMLTEPALGDTIWWSSPRLRLSSACCCNRT